ncbi:hypothetical protein LLE49_17365 [Alicyclobacillus tolerans]|uniref:hypothetical protein n=1 Tax=Alicyclobacillus tolerans TaxID=90970 RepID=UPI001F2621AA|nr:hypothetical protein [Alicyclobacillus tolerans]MCF8566495.1 hypothetical protein [Alicyclobacillus tolerans]
MYTATNILVCDEDQMYTVLNRYNPKTHFFEGEYSLVHNAYSNDAYFLSKFLMEHRGHSLVMIDSDCERYFQIKRDYRHYGEEDVSRYIEELSERRREDEHQLSVKQNVGQLQLLVAKKMIEQEWEAVQNRPSKSEQDTYVLLGQDFAFRRAVDTIKQVVDFQR